MTGQGALHFLLFQVIVPESLEFFLHSPGLSQFIGIFRGWGCGIHKAENQGNPGASRSLSSSTSFLLPCPQM